MNVGREVSQCVQVSSGWLACGRRLHDLVGLEDVGHLVVGGLGPRLVRGDDRLAVLRLVLARETNVVHQRRVSAKVLGEVDGERGHVLELEEPRLPRYLGLEVLDQLPFLRRRQVVGVREVDVVAVDPNLHARRARAIGAAGHSDALQLDDAREAGWFATSR